VRCFTWSSTVVMKIDLLEKKIVGWDSMSLQGYFAVGLVAFLSGYIKNMELRPTLLSGKLN
jgi:hypothetical protein